MLLLSIVIVVAIAFAWFTLRDINTPTNVPMKKADEVNGAPLPMGIPPVEVQEVAVVAKTRKPRITSSEKGGKKKPGRKKKTQ